MKRVSLHFPQNFEEKKALFVPEKGFPFFFFSCIVTLMKCAPIKRVPLPPHCVTQFASFESKLPFLTPLPFFSHFISLSMYIFSVLLPKSHKISRFFFHFPAIRATKTMSRLVYIGLCLFLIFFYLGKCISFPWPFFSLLATRCCVLLLLASSLGKWKEEEEEEEEEEALTVGEEKEVLMRRVEGGEGREDWATREGFAK